MLRAAIAFFIIGLVSYGIGAGGLGLISVEVGKTLLAVFLILAVVSFVVSLFSGRQPKLP